MSSPPATPSPQPSNPERREGETLVQLAAAAAKGDRQAFEAIHRRLSGGLYRLFMDRANGRVEVVEDLCQRTWLAVWESLQAGRYDPSRSAMTTFVYAVGYKLWLQQLRTFSRPETLVPDVADRSDASDGDPHDAAGLAELLQNVRECLNASGPEPLLTEEERGIVRASAAGASDRDLARQLNIAASTLNARKQSAFQKIRRYLAKKGHRTDSTER